MTSPAEQWNGENMASLRVHELTALVLEGRVDDLPDLVHAATTQELGHMVLSLVVHYAAVMKTLAGDTAGALAYCDEARYTLTRGDN